MCVCVCVCVCVCFYVFWSWNSLGFILQLHYTFPEFPDHKFDSFGILPTKNYQHYVEFEFLDEKKAYWAVVIAQQAKYKILGINEIYKIRDVWNVPN